MSSFLYSTIFTLIVLNYSPLGEGRFMQHGVTEESHDIRAESLKKVLEHLGTGNNPMVDSIEADDSVEVIALNRNNPVYRIALDIQDVTENTLMVTSVEDELAQHDTKIVTTTNAPDDPEEAEIETTTLFPVEKMEHLGVNSLRGDNANVVKNVQSTTTTPVVIPTTTTTTTTSTTTSPTTTTTMVNNKTETIIETVTVSDDACSEGSVRQEACNMCICIGGAYFCSKRACPTNNNVGQSQVDKLTKRPQETTAVHVNSSQSVQQVKVSTTTPISTTSTTTPKPECSGAVTKSIDCNLCVCSPYGRWACTKRSCIALTLREKASYSDGSFMNKTETLLENPYIDDDCNEGDARKWDCNSCVCFMNSWSCTDHKCPSTTPRPKIKFGDTIEACDTENDIKSVECNVCHCTRGIWICSKNDCKKIGHRYALQSRSKFRSSIGSRIHSD